jgi:glyoxylase-like metal-dependent hydrolase (beta-lactamase superfamily II)
MMASLTPGRVTELAPGVRRIVAPNPGMMTGPGTNTYILGEREPTVIDPGPAIPGHLAAIREAAGAPIRRVLVTHTHPDHSPGAALLAAATGATLIGRPAPPTGPQDATFRPDRIPGDGDTLEAREFAIEILHTPGHASNHLCYRHVGLNWIFTGDHIINGSTVVIDPPDGDMAAYLASLERLRRLDCAALAPGHGDLMHAPGQAIDGLIQHRLQREAKVVDAVTANPGATLPELVRVVYAEVDASLHALAERSLLAHLEKLEAESRVVRSGDRWSPGRLS